MIPNGKELTQGYLLSRACHRFTKHRQVHCKLAFCPVVIYVSEFVDLRYLNHWTEAQAFL